MKLLTVSLSQYTVDEETEHKAIGKLVDEVVNVLLGKEKMKLDEMSIK